MLSFLLTLPNYIQLDVDGNILFYFSLSRGAVLFTQYLMMINPNESDVQVQKTSSSVPVVIAVGPGADSMALWIAALQATEAGQCVYFISQDGWVSEPRELKRITEYSGYNQQSSLWENHLPNEKTDPD